MFRSVLDVLVASLDPASLIICLKLRYDPLGLKFVLPLNFLFSTTYAGRDC
ncbi:MAG: hypothetical protein ACI8T1_004780 [Verrucomicrobiales bacterium]|jgi:hypothetical protein